jgi:hypothetical protein
MDSSTRTQGLDGASASLSEDVPATEDGASTQVLPTAGHVVTAPGVASAKDGASTADLPTEQLVGVPAPEDAASTRDLPTAEHVVSAEGVASAKDGASTRDAATTEVRPSMVAAIREQCPACGAALAPDQRYCVVCGERCGPTRVPLADGLGQQPGKTAAAARPRRRGVQLNSTLIAGVGTLLLALGVGVLIGRSGNGSSSKTPPVRIVTVAGGGAAASAPTTSTPAQTSPPATTSATKAAGGSAAAGAKAPSKAAAAPPPNTVKVGSPGKGAGYQHGHFTGKFFGGESEE